MFEVSVIAIGFVIGFTLWYSAHSSNVNQMAFDERFHNMKIYPDFMKSVWIMGINLGILCAVCLLAILQLFFHRISDIGIGTRIALFSFFSCLLLYSAAFLFSFLLSSEIALLLVLQIPLIIIVAWAINTIYMLCSFSSSKALKRFLTYPNCFCSIGLFSSVLILWYVWLLLTYIPL
jgi:hypothetical protein